MLLHVTHSSTFEEWEHTQLSCQYNTVKSLILKDPPYTIKQSKKDTEIILVGTPTYVTVLSRPSWYTFTSVVIGQVCTSTAGRSVTCNRFTLVNICHSTIIYSSVLKIHVRHVNKLRTTTVMLQSAYWNLSSAQHITEILGMCYSEKPFLTLSIQFTFMV